MNVAIIRNGILAGGIVAVLSIAVIVVAWGSIQQRCLDAGYIGEGGITDWMIRWAFIAVLTGIVVSIAYPHASAWLRWSGMSYLALSAMAMVALDLLAYLQPIDGPMHVYPTAYLGLNAVFCLGLGILIPALNGPGLLGRWTI